MCLGPLLESSVVSHVEALQGLSEVCFLGDSVDTSYFVIVYIFVCMKYFKGNGFSQKCNSVELALLILFDVFDSNPAKKSYKVYKPYIPVTIRDRQK